MVAGSFVLGLAGATFVLPQDSEQPQIDILVQGAARRQIPVAIPPLTLTDPGQNLEAAEIIRSVLTSDLTFSGLFNVLPPPLYQTVRQVADRVPLRDFAAVGAEGVISGVVGSHASGIVVEGLLFDARTEALITGKRYRGSAALARDIAHRVANEVMIAYTGRAGVSLSRIALVGRIGGAKEILVMDYDGAGLKQITSNGTINVSPAWSPDGKHLAFISYRQGNPHLYIYNGEDGSLLDSTPEGSELCVAPDWSPDGRSIAFSSSNQGDSDIYILDVARKGSRRITFSRGSDTSPAWSPSGREIAFTSDRSGSPQVYVMDAQGANLRRLTGNGSYNDSSAWSPSGDRIAYVSRIEGRFDILLHDIASGAVSRLTQNAGNNENPGWSPDSRHIVFSSNRSGAYRLYTMDADGNRQEPIQTSFEATMPDWSR